MDNKERLIRLIKKNNLKSAYELSRNYIKEHQKDEQFVILYIMLGIAIDEIEDGFTDIFSALETKDIDELIAHFQNIKFCVRRFEYEVGERAREEAMEYFRSFDVSLYAIVHIVQYACVAQNKTISEIAGYFEKEGDFENAEILRRSL